MGICASGPEADVEQGVDSSIKLEEVKATMPSDPAGIIRYHAKKGAKEPRLLATDPSADITAECLKQGILFTDPDFPPQDGWKRLGQELKDPCIFLDGVCADDVKQGFLGNCWFIAIMASVANARPGFLQDSLLRRDAVIDFRQDEVKNELGGSPSSKAAAGSDGEIKMVKPEEVVEPAPLQKSYIDAPANEVGVYTIRLFDAREGRWGFVVIDDYVPWDSERDEPKMARTQDANEMWPCLLEKVFAKLAGDYKGLVGSNQEMTGNVFFGGNGPKAVMTAITGGESSMLTIDKDFKSNDDLFSAIKENLSNHCICTTYMGENGKNTEAKTNKDGLVNTHAYSIVGCTDVLGPQLLQIRNTWGNTEWKGKWNDDDERWTEEAKELVSAAPLVIGSFAKSDDGIFFIEIGDYKENYDYLVCCKMGSTSLPPEVVSVEHAWTDDHALNRHFKGVFNLPQMHVMQTSGKDCQCVIKIQADPRHDHHKELSKTMSMHLRLHKTKGRKSRVSSGDCDHETAFTGGMKVKLPVTLESGASYTAVVYARFQDKLKQPMPFVATISADPGSGAVVERIGDLVGKSLSGSWDKKRHELSADEKNFKAPQFLVCSPHEEEVTFELKADAQSFIQMVLFQVPNQFPIHSSTGPGIKEAARSQYYDSSAVSFSHVLQKGTLYILVCRQAKLECGFELSAKSETKLSAFQQL